MIRKKTGFKELTILVLASAALVSVACGDDDGTGDPGASGSSGTGTAGSSSTAGKNNGGSAGKDNGGSAGKDNGGTSNGGTSNGGTGNGGTSGGGTAGSDSIGGEAGMGGIPTDGGMGGEGGEPIGGAGAGDGGMGGEGGAAEPEMDVLKNTGFEQPIGNGTQPPDSNTVVFPEWSNVTTPPNASYIKWGNFANNEQHGGSVRLAQYSATAFTATVEQEVSPIANGKYAFSVWITRAGIDKMNESYLYAVGNNVATPNMKQTASTDTAIGSTWVKVTLSPIVVESGSVTVGMWTDAKAEGWINFDDAVLERLPD